MSRVKQYMEDQADLIGRAADVAAILDDTERFAALRSVFDEAGHLSGDYADPARVLQLLVAEAVESYDRQLRGGRQAGRLGGEL